MSKPDPPTPPNPYQTAAAQTGTNVSTGVANAFLNNTNQVNPQGELHYDVSGNYDWTDPSTGTKYSIPRFTATQYPTSDQRNIQQNNQAAQFNLSQAARNQSYNLVPYLNTGMGSTLANAPAGGNAQNLNIGPARTSFDPGGQIQSSFGDAGDITKSYGPADDFSSDRQRVEDALMSRMNPQLARERGNIETRLADQGIRYGSQAYTSAMDDYNRQATDTRFGAISQAGQEQQRMMDMAAQRAGFQNAAQQQQYEQLQGRAAFGNQAAGQQFQQNAALGSFYNAGQAQNLAQQQSIFNAQNAQRNQYLQEAYQARNQPINEITSLTSGAQLQNPQWLNTPTSQIATTDFAGIMSNNFKGQMDLYGQQNQNYQQLMGGLLGLGAGAMKLSDRREKDDVDRIGTVFAASEKGERKKLPIYEYSYKKDPDDRRHVGPMAQDVEKITPGAVKTRDGRKHIDTSQVMGSILRAA